MFSTAGLWSVLTLGMGAADTDASLARAHDKLLPATPVPRSPLADQSLLLLLALTTQTATNQQAAPPKNEESAKSEEKVKYFYPLLKFY